MLMKFIDCSGTDITEKVKEVNDKEYEKVNKEIEKMKEETERKFEQVNENQKGLEKVEELNEKDLEARLKEDFFIPAEEETDESSTDVKEQAKLHVESCKVPTIETGGRKQCGSCGVERDCRDSMVEHWVTACRGIFDRKYLPQTGL